MPAPIALRRTRLARFAAGLAAALLATVGLAFATPAAAATGMVTGTVFRDFNSNGVMDTAGGLGVPVDVGYPDVTVTAYIADGSQAATTTSAADGTYALDLSALADGIEVRVQFTDLPAGAFATFFGVNNGTSVQFADVGEEDIDFGLNWPGDFTSPAAAGLCTPHQHLPMGR